MASPLTTAILLFTLLNTATASPLTKRDAGYAIPEGAIIILILLSAGLLVCMGYAIHKTFGFRRNPNEFRHMSVEQQEYMAEVRVRNMQGLMVEGAKSQRGGPRRGEVVYD